MTEGGTECIIKTNGGFYWEGDDDGYQQLSPENIYDLYRSTKTPTNKS